MYIFSQKWFQSVGRLYSVYSYIPILCVTVQQQTKRFIDAIERELIFGILCSSLIILSFNVHCPDYYIVQPACLYHKFTTHVFLLLPCPNFLNNYS